MSPAHSNNEIAEGCQEKNGTLLVKTRSKSLYEIGTLNRIMKKQKSNKALLLLVHFIGWVPLLLIVAPHDAASIRLIYQK